MISVNFKEKMGKWDFSTKQEADFLNKVRIWWLRKEGFLYGWRSGVIEWSNNGLRKSNVSIEVSLIGDLSQKEEREKYLNTDDDSLLNKYVRFRYTQTNENGEKKDFDYKVQLTTTPCNYGGVRYWFICPLVKNGFYCRRRVGVLYKGGDYFGCRHCYDLTYGSKNLNCRNGLHPIRQFLMGEKKLEEIEKGMKRRFYAGKPAKKQRKWEKIAQELKILSLRNDLN